MELERFGIGGGKGRAVLEIGREMPGAPDAVRQMSQEVVEVVKGHLLERVLPALPEGTPPLRVGVRFYGEPCFLGYALTWQITRGKKRILGGQVFSDKGKRLSFRHAVGRRGAFIAPKRGSREATLARYGRAPFGFSVRGESLLVLTPRGWERVAERKKEGDGVSQKTAMVRK